MHECGVSAPRWWRGRGDAGPRRDADAWNPGSRGCSGESRATMTEAERDSDLVESGLKGHGIERRRRDQGLLDRESRSFWRPCGGRHALRRNAAKCSCERPLSAQITTCSEPCSQRIASGGHTPAAWGGAEHARAGEWIGLAWTSGCRSVAPSISLSLPSITSIRSNRFGPREPRGFPRGHVASRLLRGAAMPHDRSLVVPTRGLIGGDSGSREPSLRSPRSRCS
jgi:hypothetical protein